MLQEFTSMNTSVNKNKLPRIFHQINWISGTKNLDYGSGKFMNQVEFLESLNVRCYRYDPYNVPERVNQVALASAPYDTITISNVLNVIKEKEIRCNIINKCLSLLKDDGVIYVTVYTGNRTGIGKISKKDCWQNNCNIGFYISEISEITGVTVSRKGQMIIIKKER